MITSKIKETMSLIDQNTEKMGKNQSEQKLISFFRKKKGRPLNNEAKKLLLSYQNNIQEIQKGIHKILK